MSVTREECVQQCRDYLDLLPRQALDKARETRPDLGGFAVFPVYAPIEIIHAAGLMPVGMFGAGDKLEITHADSRFQSFICSIAKSTLELFLAGEMDGFEGAVFSSICDVARNLASLVQRNTPDLYIEYLHLPQNMESAASVAYTTAEFERFRDKLSARVGRPITDEAIGKSLTIYNRVRELTRELYDHRKKNPCIISAADLTTVVRAGTLMMPEDFVPMLELLAADVRNSKARPRDGVNVVIEGAFCEQPPIALIEVIESSGCLVKDDDLTIGWRLYSDNVSANGQSTSPLEALARAYLSASVYTSTRYDRANPRTIGLMNRMEKSGAEAVVFAPAKFCEPALLDYVLFRKMLEEKDVPHIKIEFEEKMWTFENSRTEVETFAESMLFD
jgi:benzoyl-CoA reductase subunit C